MVLSWSVLLTVFYHFYQESLPKNCPKTVQNYILFAQLYQVHFISRHIHAGEYYLIYPFDPRLALSWLLLGSCLLSFIYL